MRGLNLPATQGTSNAGNFLPGVHRLDYSAEDLDKVRQNRFNALRLPVNVSTASDRSALLKMRNVFETLGGEGLLCFFEESLDPAAAPHGNGSADVVATSAAWRQAHEVFADSKVLYEIFNEPFGYEKPELYLYDMLLILHHAQLPLSRCVLDGKGYADDIRALHRLGWNGFLAYHFYPNWLPEGHRSEDAYEQKVLQDVSEVADRAFITEFGAALNLSPEQQAGHVPSEDAQCLRGLAAAVRQLPKLRGVFHWHGWGNGDTYDFGDGKNELGADLVQSVLEGSGTHPPTSGTDAEPVALFRKGEMTYLVLLSDARFPQMPGWGWSFERIACYCWREATAPADAVPVNCWRKGEAALYGIVSYESAALACGFAFESVAFYALPPSASPASELSAVHEWRKEEMTYYARDDWEGYGSLPSWGWTHHCVAFCAPLA